MARRPGHRRALQPATVIAGHKDPAPLTTHPRFSTRRYLTDARRLLSSSGSAQEFYDEMLRLHPTGSNRRAVGCGNHAVSNGVTALTLRTLWT